MNKVFTNAKLLLLLAGLASLRLAAQQVNPGNTFVPARIVEQVDADGHKGDGADSTLGVLSSGTSPMKLLNEKLPRWLRFSLIDRVRFEGYSGLNFKSGPKYDDSYLLNRFRFGTLIRPTSWLSFYGELQDTRAVWKTPPVGPPNQSTWDIRQAFVELGGGEGQFYDIKVGREELNFGGGRLIGKSDWRNVGRTFDAASALFHAGRFRVTAFSASIVNVAPEGISHHLDGNNIHGLYGGIDNIIPNSVLEPYVFLRTAPSVKSDFGKVGELDEKVVGLRWAGMVTRRFDYAAEFAGEKGNIAREPIGAWMSSLSAGYTITSIRPKPRFFAEYNFASGKQNPKDGTHSTWDLLYPTVHDRHGMADVIGPQNLKEFKAGSKFFLTRNWAAAGIYNNWYLDSAKDALYNSSGSVLVAADPKGKSGTHIGQEFDIETSFRLNREVELGTGIGHILPGTFLKNRTPGKGYTYPYIMMNFTL